MSNFFEQARPVTQAAWIDSMIARGYGWRKYWRRDEALTTEATRICVAPPSGYACLIIYFDAAVSEMYDYNNTTVQGGFRLVIAGQSLTSASSAFSSPLTADTDMGYAVSDSSAGFYTPDAEPSVYGEDGSFSLSYATRSVVGLWAAKSAPMINQQGTGLAGGPIWVRDGQVQWFYLYTTCDTDGYTSASIEVLVIPESMLFDTSNANFNTGESYGDGTEEDVT